ncbi:MAG: hypothetical protein AAF317_02805 [Pseudomonadota bacterium]
MYDALIHGARQPVILIVCPPSHDQQGRKFAATMRALEGWPIEAVYMADTLDRNNGKSHDAAYDAGTAWIERHALHLGDLPIVRWDAIRADADFERRFDEIHALYDRHPIARRAVDDICRPHAELQAQRIIAKGDMPDRCRLMRHSVNYMLEEIAGLSIIRSRTAAPEVYPGQFFADLAIFDRLSDVPLLLPSVLRVTFEKQSAPSVGANLSRAA